MADASCPYASVVNKMKFTPFTNLFQHVKSKDARLFDTLTRIHDYLADIYTHFTEDTVNAVYARYVSNNMVGGILTPVKFDSLIFGSAPFVDNPASKVKIKVDGIYRFVGSVTIPAYSGARNIYICLRINGTDIIASATMEATVNMEETLQVNAIYPLKKEDYVELLVLSSMSLTLVTGQDKTGLVALRIQ